MPFLFPQSRALSILVLAGVLLLTAGCVGLPGGIGAEAHHEIHVKNNHNTTHQVTVEVTTQSGDTVLEETQALSPDENWHVTTQNESGSYTLSVRTNAHPVESTEYELPIAEGDLHSYTTIRIRSSGELHIRTKYQE